MPTVHASRIDRGIGGRAINEVVSLQKRNVHLIGSHRYGLLLVSETVQ